MVTLFGKLGSTCAVTVRWTVQFAALCALFVPLQSLASTNDAVGEVTLVIGEAFVQGDADGAKRARVVKGSPVTIGDRVVTSSNGHVHIRFIDQGLVSVRPASRLKIESYEYNQQDALLSRVKFELEEGVVRSVSGNATKAARSRFRLNTPIAAIGVRGTDFVVSAGSDHVRALVNEGTIVVAPFSATCTATALGPCDVNAVELSEGSNQILEFKHLQMAPTLLPLQENSAPELTAPPSTAVENEAASAGAGEVDSDDVEHPDAYVESKLNQTLEDGNKHRSRAIQSPQLANPSLDAASETLPAATIAVNPDALTSRSMAWGRWSESSPELDRLALRYEDASRGRQVAVANQDYILYRADLGTEHVRTGLGRIDFDLYSAAATITTGVVTEGMTVSDGRLVSISTTRPSRPAWTCTTPLRVPWSSARPAPSIRPATSICARTPSVSVVRWQSMAARRDIFSPRRWANVGSRV
ncbi:MAG: FecR domain-containing protein [Gammaproteobacteria bacterium]|nr:FecR domain-containing protein [Gammaproteobacteria bacterium]